MACYCADCKNLDLNKTKDGKVSGKLYYCKKAKKYVNPSMCSCDSFNKTYSRNRYECEKIYKDGKAYDDNDMPLGVYITIFMVLLVLSLVMGVLK